MCCSRGAPADLRLFGRAFRGITLRHPFCRVSPLLRAVSAVALIKAGGVDDLMYIPVSNRQVRFVTTRDQLIDTCVVVSGQWSQWLREAQRDFQGNLAVALRKPVAPARPGEVGHTHSCVAATPGVGTRAV